MALSTANVQTASGSKYLQQLCKHWSHNLTVEFTADHGTVIFPKDARGADFPGDGLVTFDARADALQVRIAASAWRTTVNISKQLVAIRLGREPQPNSDLAEYPATYRSHQPTGLTNA